MLRRKSARSGRNHGRISETESSYEGGFALAERFIKDFRWLPVSPITAIMLFTLVFDLSVQRLDFSTVFENANVTSLTVRSSLFILQLGCGLVLFSGLVACYLAYLQSRRIHATSRCRWYYVWLLIGVLVLFVGYHTVAYEHGFSTFRYFIEAIFQMHLKGQIIEQWSISGIELDLLFKAPFFAVIITSVYLATTSTSLGEPIALLPDLKSAGRQLRDRRRMIGFSFFAAAILISAIMIFIFAWHNLMRAAIVGTKPVAEFTAFMFAFSTYWGVAYSVLILAIFGPLAVLFNTDLEAFLDAQPTVNEAKSSEVLQDLSLDWIRLGDFTNLFAALSPLLTALVANSLSLLASAP